MQQNESLFDNRVYTNTGTTSVEQMHFFQASCHLTEQKSSSENIWQDITLKKKKKSPASKAAAQHVLCLQQWSVEADSGKTMAFKDAD